MAAFAGAAAAGPTSTFLLPPPQPARISASAAAQASSGKLIRRRLNGRATLLDGHGLGQIPWLVDVQALLPRDVIGEQLERDDRDDRLQDPVGSGDEER